MTTAFIATTGGHLTATGRAVAAGRARSRAHRVPGEITVDDLLATPTTTIRGLPEVPPFVVS